MESPKRFMRRHVLNMLRVQVLAARSIQRSSPSEAVLSVPIARSSWYGQTWIATANLRETGVVSILGSRGFFVHFGHDYTCWSVCHAAWLNPLLPQNLSEELRSHAHRGEGEEEGEKAYEPA